MVRGHVGGDPDAGGLRLGDATHRPGGGQVRQVETAPRQVREEQVAGHDDLLGLGGVPGQAQERRVVPLVHLPALGQDVVLGVLHHDHVERRGVLECQAHDSRRLDALPVVGEDPDPGLRHLADVREQLALEASGDGSGGVDVAQGGLVRQGPDLRHHRDAVGDGVGVRHGAHRGEPPGGRRSGPRLDRLLVLEPGLPKVGVQVDEAGGHHQPVGVQDVRLCGDHPALDRADLLVLDQDVGDLIGSGRRVDQPDASNDGPPGHLRPPSTPRRQPVRRPRHGFGLPRASGTGATSEPRSRWSPDPRSPRAAGRRRPTRSPRRGSSVRGA